MKKFPNLTSEEETEIKELSRKLFKGSLFVVFSKEEQNSPSMKRYNELLAKKMAHLSEVNRLVMCN
jgi:hypothetical protein